MKLSDYPVRQVAGLNIPLPLVPRIIEAIRARYPQATEGIEDPEAAVRSALRAWVAETLADYEHAKTLEPLKMTIVQTTTDFEQRARGAKAQALQDASLITDAVVPPPTEVTPAPAGGEPAVQEPDVS